MTVCAIPGLNLRITPNQVPLPEYSMSEQLDLGVAILAGGCFWCTEAVFKQLKGVLTVQPGYAGGHPERANYQAVCTGVSGHAEVIKIAYDPKLISYGRLLQVFFAVAHDATQLNRQGNDIGTSYRSGIYYTTEEQHQIALKTIQDVNSSGIWPGKVRTEVKAASDFWEAEPEHQDYLERYPTGYTCHRVRPDWVLP